VTGDLGPFFAVSTHEAGSPVREPWRPMRELVDGSGALADRVAAVRAGLAAAGARPVGDVEPRVAASVAHLGLVARLISPVLAAEVAPGEPVVVDLDTARWQPVLGGPFPLSVPSSTRGVPVPALLDGPVRLLVEAMRPWSVSPRVLWGNVASAVNGAATMLAAARPQWADRTRVLASGLLDHPGLRATWTAGPRFRRRSCCLIYRAAATGPRAVCGDCVLTAVR
jgi:FhuF 2Fe-2S C-terminal domain